MLKAEIVRNIDGAIVRDTVSISRDSYPEDWAYSDAEEYYGNMLGKDTSIHVMLKEDGKRIGFLLAIPHNDAVAELEADDPLMKPDPSTYYIENVAILPNYRKQKAFPQLNLRTWEFGNNGKPGNHCHNKKRRQGTWKSD